MFYQDLYYEELEHGTEFIECGRRYIVCKNISHWLRFISPGMGDFVLVIRPDDNGITFRGGQIHENVVVLKKTEQKENTVV